MAVVLRLKRGGRKNRPFYRICVFDTRTRRDGRTIEEIGHYDPIRTGGEPQFDVKEERAKYWLSVGARPSETVASLLRRSDVEVPDWGANRRAKARARRKAKAAASSKKG